MSKSIPGNKGFLMIEVLLTLMLSSLLVACLYWTFVRWQKTHTVEEQIADAQQNIRVVVERMNRDISMAGFGNPKRVLALTGGVNGFTNIVTPSGTKVTLIGGFKPIRYTDGTPVLITSASANTIILNHPTDEFNGSAHKFISIGGMESFVVQNQPTGSTAKLILDGIPVNPVGKCVYKIQAISYDLGVQDGRSGLRVDDNMGGGPQVLAENITSLAIKYFDNSSPPVQTAVPAAIRLIQVELKARVDRVDPDYKINGGYRTRKVASKIYLRNMDAAS